MRMIRYLFRLGAFEGPIALEPCGAKLNPAKHRARSDCRVSLRRQQGHTELSCAAVSEVGLVRSADDGAQCWSLPGHLQCLSLESLRVRLRPWIEAIKECTDAPACCLDGHLFIYSFPKLQLARRIAVQFECRLAQSAAPLLSSSH